MLITIRPGPLLCVWRDRQLMLEVELTSAAALCIAGDLLREASVLQNSPMYTSQDQEVSEWPSLPS